MSGYSTVIFFPEGVNAIVCELLGVDIICSIISGCMGEYSLILSPHFNKSKYSSKIDSKGPSVSYASIVHSAVCIAVQGCFVALGLNHKLRYKPGILG
ncbi:hypothetical protein RCL_jg22976.t1 [Rhizophagus clarus]|uniref:Uncharacterized protein n=1 Tax=Rhizophagus clarus TaxID=94130 RepID=A0A8H3QGI0_9GLOM|nr:hypothetical protein RCL_jg22976.t1 [Rhizophagus clarus]